MPYIASITEKDKDRLARIMAFGKEAEEARLRKQYTNTDADEETAQEEPEIDRFDECKGSNYNVLKFAFGVKILN